MGSDRCSKYVRFWTMEIWAAVHTSSQLNGLQVIPGTRTVAMAMVFYGNTQNFEGVHPDGGVLDALLAFQDQVGGARQQANEGIALGSCQEDLAKLQAQNFTHSVKTSLELRGAVPVAILVTRSGLLALGFSTASDGCCRCLLRRLCLHTRDSPLQEEAIYLEELLVV